jgi:hypothetical protein
LSAAPSPAVTSDAFAEAFGLLCFLHVLLFLATLRLPWLVPDAVQVRDQLARITQPNSQRIGGTLAQQPATTTLASRR